MYKYVWGNTCFILYTNSEDPDEMQHKVAFHQDLLHCSALPSARTEKHNLIYFTYPLQYIFGMKRVNRLSSALQKKSREKVGITRNVSMGPGCPRYCH